MSLFSLLDYGAKRYPGDPAVFEGARVVYDWRSLRERAQRLAAGIRSHLAAGERVAIASANCREYVEIMFGAWGAGLVVVPVNAKLHALEMGEILDDAGAAMVFASPELSSSLEELRRGQRRIITIGGEEYERLMRASPAPPQDVPQEALAWLFYTSGTTGRSKGAMLSHRNLRAMTIAHLADFEHLEHGDAILHAAPMSHGSGLYILPYVARAAPQIIPRSGSFNPGDFLDLCAAHGRVGAFFAPTMLRRLRLELERTGRRAEGLRSVIYGGGPMYVEELKKCLATFGPILTQLYGQGEAPMTITGLRRREHEIGDETVLRSVGWPRSGVEVAILDEAGQASSAGEIGEVACRGDVVMSGYWNNPAATAAALRRGWLLTGDRGYLDAEGKLTLEGRSKELIISGGANIYPREVEEALLSCPGVAEAAVAGQTDPEWGEIVVAFIVQDSACTLDASALDEHCRIRIARFKHPKRYVFVDALPKNNYGKIVKRELAQLLGGRAPVQ
jgi:acyl-CoA synthetase (AMP-forming)/AMP-acid ligase II